MTRPTLALPIAALLLFGCNSAPKESPEPVNEALDKYVLDAVPNDIQHRLLVDFEGKAQLIGYDLKPEGVVKPGETLNIRLYWRSVKPLSKGWSLFTHLLNPRGMQMANRDNVGPLRQTAPGSTGQALPPSAWQPGKIYIDEQALQIPPEVTAPAVTISVGIWNTHAIKRMTPDGGTSMEQHDVRLTIISGPRDDKNRGIVATVMTGMKPKPPEKQTQEDKPADKT